jgi:glycosyltransferase involved in cell wall biosynthesis
MRPLHILYVCPDARDARLVQHTGTLALAMLKEGLRVSLLLGGVSHSPLAKLKDVEVHNAPIAPTWQFWRHPLKTKFYDVVQADATIDIAHVVSLTHEAWALPTMAKKLRVPCVVQAQNDACLDATAWRKNCRKDYQKALEACTPLVVSSQHQLDKTKLLGLTRVTLIHEGVDTEAFKPVLSKRPLRRNLNLPELGTLVCCMASISPENKQLETLQKCLPLSEKLRLVFVGPVVDKNYLAQIQTLVTDAGASGFVHWVDAAANPADYLRAADVFMLLGGIETRQLTVLEAQSCGLPVVLGPSASALALTNGGRSGIVLTQGSDRQLRRLLTNAAGRQTKGMNGRPFVKKIYDFEQMVQAYLTLYRSL